MSEVSFDGIMFEPSFDCMRCSEEFKGGGNALTMIAGIAVSIAVPFLAPTVAGAIFGASAMAGLSGAILAGGVGAAMGAAGAYLTGNDPLMGALTGGLGAGAVQGFGAFGAVSPAAQGGTSFLAQGGVGTGLANFGGAAPATTAGLTTPTGAAISATQQAAISGLGAAPGVATSTAAGAAPGLLGLDPVTSQKLINASLGVAPQAIGALGAELLPPSEGALANEQMLTDQYNQQRDAYNAAMASANGISPELMAQNLANQAQLQSAQVIAEGDPTGTQGAYDPAREQARIRKQSVVGSAQRGTGYIQGMMAGTQLKNEAVRTATGLMPNSATYMQNLSDYGADAERKRRAEAIGGFATPFANVFSSAPATSQVKP